MKCLAITYRDELGGIASLVDEQDGIIFCDGKVYFTTLDGADHEVDVENVHAIGIWNK